MPRIQGNVGSLIQGVSQQDLRTRLSGYHTEQDNFIPDITKGLVKRPPTELIAKLTSATDTKSKMHYIKRREGDEYILVITNADIKVFDLNGTEQTLAISTGALSYLTSTDVNQDISLVTIGDYTVINNRNITPIMTGQQAGASTGGKFIEVKSGEFNTTYEISITLTSRELIGSGVLGTFTVGETVIGNTSGASGYLWKAFGEHDLLLLNEGASKVIGAFQIGETVIGGTSGASMTLDTLQDTPSPQVITVSTPDGSSASHGEDIKVGKIAADLDSAVGADTTLKEAGYTTMTDDDHSDVIYLTNSDATKNLDITMRLNDSQSGKLLADVSTSVKSIEDLPTWYVGGYTLKISPNKLGTEGDFYMKYSGPSTLNHTNVWEEVAKTGVEIAVDRTTTPHALVRLSDGTFYFGTLSGDTVGGTVLEDWSQRKVGDDTSNPLPVWIGKPIEYVTVFQQRLVFLTDEFVSMSHTSQFFNFFRATATEVIDSDPIEISPVSSQINILKKSIVQDRDLLVFSENNQYIISGTQELTPSTILMTEASSFNSRLISDILSTGSTALFPAVTGSFSVVRELYTANTQGTRKSNILTTLVPEYISGEIIRSAISTDLKLVLLQGSSSKDIYCWKYIDNNEQRLQSSWFKIVTNVDIIDFKFSEKDLLLLLKDTTGVYLNKMNFDDLDLTGLNYNIYVDTRETFSSVTTSITSTTDVDSNTIVVQGDGCPNAGYTVGYTNVGKVITLDEDMLGGTVYLGKVYSSSFKPTPPRQFNRNGQPMSTGRLLINTYNIEFFDTVKFDTSSTSKGTTYNKEYEGVISGESLLGNPDISSGVFKVAIKEKNFDSSFSITSNTHFPVNISQIDFEGQYNPKARR